jgi:hypothetical protein
MMTVSAAHKLMPRPPARVESKNGAHPRHVVELTRMRRGGRLQIKDGEGGVQTAPGNGVTPPKYKGPGLYNRMSIPDPPGGPLYLGGPLYFSTHKKSMIYEPTNPPVYSGIWQRGNAGMS